MALDSKPGTTHGTSKDAVISIGNGVTLNQSDLSKLREAAEMVDYQDARAFLGKPEVLFSHPTRGAHYAWPIKNSKTAGLCKGGMYRVVKPAEIKDDCPYEIVKVSDRQIEWENHILVEISEAAYKTRFVSPMWKNTLLLSKVREQFASAAARAGLPIQTEVTAAHNGLLGASGNAA